MDTLLAGLGSARHASAARGRRYERDRSPTRTVPRGLLKKSRGAARRPETIDTGLRPLGFGGVGSSPSLCSLDDVPASPSRTTPWIQAHGARNAAHETSSASPYGCAGLGGRKPQAGNDQLNNRYELYRVIWYPELPGHAASTQNGKLSLCQLSYTRKDLSIMELR